MCTDDKASYILQLNEEAVFLVNHAAGLSVFNGKPWIPEELCSACPIVL